MGRTNYVTVPVSEYAVMQRIIGVASCTVRQIPVMYGRETALLRQALTDYEERFGKPRTP